VTNEDVARASEPRKPRKPASDKEKLLTKKKPKHETSVVTKPPSAQKGHGIVIPSAEVSATPILQAKTAATKPLKRKKNPRGST
jgi:hypothetical protein